jgi:hypothetical protein
MRGCWDDRWLELEANGDDFWVTERVAGGRTCPCILLIVNVFSRSSIFAFGDLTLNRNLLY